MNEQSMKLIKSTKNMTLTLAIIYTIMSIFSVFGSIGVMITRSIDYSQLEGMTSEQIEMINAAVSPVMMYLTYIITILSIVLTVFLYIFNAKLKKGQIVNKIPYLGVGALQIYSLVNNVIALINMGFLGLVTNLIPVVINVVILVIAGLALMNLIKLDSEK